MTWDEAIALYDDMLDQLTTVKIGNLEYSVSRVLREVDPTAYRTGFSDWADSVGIDIFELEGVNGLPA